MKYYQVVNLFLESEDMPERYRDFEITGAPDASSEKLLTVRYRPREQMKSVFTPAAEVSGLRIGPSPEGWIFEEMESGCRMLIDPGYSSALISDEIKEKPGIWAFLLQLFIEGRLLDEGVLTLHSSCVKEEGKAYAFSGPSGCGKSTRARMWTAAFGSEYISGDRPAVDAAGKMFYGIPWDGKEQIFRSVSAPAGAVFQVRRASFTRLRRLSAKQARNFLISQIYFPMWDSERAMEAMLLLQRLAGSFPVFRLFCDKDIKAAEETKNILMHHQELIMEEGTDMKLNEGFVLKSMAGEHVLMPSGANIAKFNGTVLLNEVSAFILQKLSNGALSREDLLQLLLSEYEVDRETAEQDLKELMEQLSDMGVVSEE